MHESFIYSINAVAPIFILAVLGYELNKIKLVSDKFLAVSDRLVFYVSLPALLFCEITEAAEGSGGSSAAALTLFCLAGILAVFLAALVIVPLTVKGNPQRGSMVQATFRSNFAILGIPLAQNMFGDAGVQRLAMTLPFCIALFNALAVTSFSMFAPEDKRLSPSAAAKKIAASIAKNPLIISIVLALAISLLPIKLPQLITKPLGYLGNLTLPLSLISLGAGFSLSALRGSLKLALVATAVKMIIVPVAAVGVAVALGFRGIDLGVVLILFGGPSAVSGYIMAKNMGGDHELTGQITLLTTFACVFTLFLSVFGLRFAGLI